MRIVLVLFSLACACSTTGDACSQDSDCGGGDVCSRDDMCWPSDEVHAIKVSWTIGGSAVGSASCAAYPTFMIMFYSYDTQFGYAPVPCIAGEFPIDKLPTIYNDVELSNDSEPLAFDQTARFDLNGSASFDLVP